ncbi:MAG TPA: hypothetical protein V6D22_22305 [Candidatus Obscuribacterales bacterium]
MADNTTNEAELGRSKQSATPKEHLLHLLNIGWHPRSPLIVKFATENGLIRDLERAADEMRQ